VKALFVDYDDKAANLTDDEVQKRLTRVETRTIEEAPVGLVICYDRSGFK
jgi:nicotinate-nucleotide--dimethylbenzimidazole phosphoribosyltransferase